MLDIRAVVENPAWAEAGLDKRNMQGAKEVLKTLIELDLRRRQTLQSVEALKAKRNQASQQIAELKKNKQDATALMEEMKTVSTTIKEQDVQVAEIEEKLKSLIMELPNVPDASVPPGKSAEDNKEVRRWGTIPKFDFKPLTHDEIGEKMGLMHFKKAGEVTGARFVFLTGLAAKLERALIQLMLDTHTATGYTEIQPPFMVNRAALTGTGQLPKFEEDVFRIEKFDYFLIPTAEVPVTNFHREEILEESALPIKYAAYSPCFRSEAGSYGKDTKGLKRQHQFNKVELVKFTRPEDGFAELEKLTVDAEKILQLLGLPYRTVLLCGGDMGFGSAKTYDIEVWSPATNGYMEISSCSCFTDYQARRAGIRYRSAADRKVQFAYTLNGSGLAVGRTLIALMENYQKADGTFTLPEILNQYL
ncbi:serine--tRNA ligase [bacterium]|nr:serine--tRNA ligase [bacterium]